MQLDALLEVAIGLIFTWLILSVATMHIQDFIGRVFEWRAKFLEQGIYNMLKDPELVERIYKEPLIEALGQMDRKGRIHKPTSIPNASFAAAMMEVIINAGKDESELPVETMSIARIRAGVKRLKDRNPDLARTLERVLPGLENQTLDVEDTLAKYHENIANWFDTVMNQATIWYRSHAQTWAFVIGLIIATIFHIDTIHITNQLWRQPTLRAVIVAQADNRLQAGQAEIGSVAEEFQNLGIPVGWSTVPAEDLSSCQWPPKATNRPALWTVGECRELINLPKQGDVWGWLLKVLGLAVSGVAAMQGAPFWFDILRRLVGFRTQGGSSPAQTSAPARTLPAPIPTGPAETGSGRESVG